MHISNLVDLSNDDDLFYTGTQISYYFVCKRKLWLYSHDIQYEQESDIVKLGRLLHEEQYQKKLKEIHMDKIAIDFI